jgi:transcriptional regulator with XRE-family HTH domain
VPEAADATGMRVGEELRRAREEAGMSQTALAQKAGLHRVYLSQLENDKKSPTLEKFFALCVALNIAPSKLMARIEREH